MSAVRNSRLNVVVALTAALTVGVLAGAPIAVVAKGKPVRTEPTTTEPTTDSTTEPTTDSTTEPTTDSTTEPTTDSTTEPTTNTTTKGSTTKTGRGAKVSSSDSTTSTSTSTDSTTSTSTSTDSTTTSPGTSLSTVIEQIGADDMWAAGYTGTGIDVAVIDTGVAPIAELSTTDVFVGPDLSFEGGVDEVAGLDTYGHGTHMIGIIAGRTPGADPLHPKVNDFLGVAPDAGIVSVKVAGNSGAVDVSQVIAAIDWVVQNRQANGLNIRVLNLSYNTTGTQNAIDDPISKAVENAWKHGIAVVVSAGNEGRGSYGLANPATNPYVVAVSAAELFQGYGWGVPVWAPSGDGVRNPDVLAPGVSIKSLRVPGSRIDVEHPEARVAGDDRLFLGSGTSQAAAVTSGAIALLLDQRPDLTPDELKSVLTSSATDIFERETFKGHGLIDLGAAMHTTANAAPQHFESATGLGSLEAARGDDHVEVDGAVLEGEFTVTGAAWNPQRWVAASESASAWTGEDVWSGSSWSGSSWSGSSWSGSSWSGSSWSGSSWSGSSWSGSSWSGSSWSGSSWSGSSWSGSSWSGSSWSGSSWSGSSWS